ncbi:LysR family transcriptional regulator [Thalassotalea psychrophila]|uniref:LysR family transcriptional regulator n=1 Tax=Thalassotalea psychrophila TaxID=3065647 RepID=A0ABY9TUT6_9GAMM|nr:LysR family transcriptional regulator [Colwelliaceae bacterium SQ149]
MRSIEQQLSRLDLNLLVSLSTLLKERNVSRAAEKLYLSQPAMSRALKKLRIMFDDPLFHRETSGLRPTVKAQELEIELAQLLNSIRDFIEGDEFKPKNCTKTFNISIPSLMSYPLLLPLINELENLAPKVVIAQHSSSNTTGKELENGTLDFSIHVHNINEDSFSSTFLGQVYPVIIARKGHPLTKLKDIKIEDCLQYKFVDVVYDNPNEKPLQNPAKRFLEEHNLQLRIAMKSGQLSFLTEVMKNSDHLLISNHFLLQSADLKKDFTHVYTMYESMYAVNVYLIDHQRTHNNKAHLWFKQVLINSLKATILSS